MIVENTLLQRHFELSWLTNYYVYASLRTKL